MQPNTILSLPNNIADLVPAPNVVRLAIAAKSAEIAVLRRLLKAAETKARLYQNVKPEVAGVAHAN